VLRTPVSEALYARKINNLREHFQLIRRLDDLMYDFDRVEIHDGVFGYKRRDADLWINWHQEYGWVAWDGESEYIGGRPWYVLPQNQLSYPPEGLWVSYKDNKSYVYDLIYPKPMNHE